METHKTGAGRTENCTENSIEKNSLRRITVPHLKQQGEVIVFHMGFGDVSPFVMF